MGNQAAGGGAAAPPAISQAELKRVLDLLEALRVADSANHPTRQKFPDEAELTRQDSVLGYQALAALSGRGGSASALIAQAKRFKAKIQVVTTATLDTGSTIQVIGTSGTREHLSLDARQTAQPQRIPDAEPIAAIRIFDPEGAYTAWVGPLPAYP